MKRLALLIAMSVAAASFVALAGPSQAATPPGPPTGVSVGTSTTTTATVTWSAPASDGGSPITIYVATATPTISTNPTRTCSTTGATTCTISGLAAGQFYSVSVVAGNPDLGPASVSTEDIPIGNGLPAVQQGPFVTSIAPFYGTHKGGTRLTIRGDKLRGATKVTFNGVKGTHLVVISNTKIKVTTPKSAVGPASVVISTPTGKARSYSYSFVQ